MKIDIYSPSGAVRNRAAFRRGLAVLKKRGYEPEVDIGALATFERFAGDDASRLEAIKRVAQSPNKLALISRGGYGLTRLLAKLPYKDIARSIDAGKRWIGFSDFTALSLAVYAKTGRITWAGPALLDDFGVEGEVDDIMLDTFDDAAHGISEGCGWRVGLDDAKAYAKGFETKPATLWGGNLSMLVSLLGTPYFPQIEAGILFIEEVNEHPYRVERLLLQLLHAGVLAKQKAVVIGQISGFKKTPHDKGFSLKGVVSNLREQLKCPVLTGLPFGHVPTKVVLPVGAQTRLILEGRDAFLLWGHEGHDHHGHEHHHH